MRTLIALFLAAFAVAASAQDAPRDVHSYAQPDKVVIRDLGLDLRVDFAAQTRPSDRVAVIVTAPLTRNETWHAFEASSLKVFVDGAVQAY